MLCQFSIFSRKIVRILTINAHVYLPRASVLSQKRNYVVADQNQSGIPKSMWEALKKQEPYQIQHYNRLLQVATDGENSERAQEFVNELMKNGIKPDVISYKYLLSSYCAAGHIEKTIENLNKIDKDNMPIDEETLNNVVQCHIICGNIQAANEKIASLKHIGQKLHFRTLDAFLSHYAKSGDLNNIQKTLDLFKEENFEWLNRDILKVISELLVNEKMDKIESSSSNLKVNIVMRRALENVITSSVEKKQSVHALKIIQLFFGNSARNYKHLIQEMVRLSSPEDELKEVIDKIESTGITVEKHFDVFRSAIDGSSEEIIRRLLAHMKSHSIEMDEYTFKKLFELAAKKDSKEVLCVVNLMCSQFNIQPEISYIRDVILPSLNCEENPALAFESLQATHINPQTSLFGIISERLHIGDLKSAYKFATTNEDFYAINFLKLPLIYAFTTTDDVPSFVAFVLLMYKSFYHEKPEISVAETPNKQIEFVSGMLYSAIYKRRNDMELIAELLNAFVNEGIPINDDVVDKIETLFEDNDPRISRSLKKLSSNELTLKQKVSRKLDKAHSQSIVLDDSQSIVEVESTVLTKKRLFLAYVREENIVEINKLLASKQVILTHSDYAHLIEMYTKIGNLEYALITLKRASKTSFRMKPKNVAKLVTLMVDEGCTFENIDPLLLAHSPKNVKVRSIVFEDLLNRLATTGQEQFFHKLFDALLKYKYIEATPESTEPLVLASLEKDSCVDAVANFEYLADTYKLVPRAMELFCQLIRVNEIDLLQRASETVERVLGTHNALCRLAFAFIECDLDPQAEEIFQNYHIKNLSKVIATECQQYVTYEKLKAAKTLLKVTKGIDCNRHVIYETILDICYKQNNAEEALLLWCEYTSDSIQPQETFKIKLAELLKVNNFKLPFDLDF